jgi:RimJ/RimL family protein N-acetyltransferase
MSFPQFDTSDLSLRPFLVGDEVAWLAYLEKPEVICLTGWQVSSLSELSALMQPDRHHGPIRFALTCKRDGRLVGTIGFLDLADGQAEIAYDLAPHLWGKGITGAACARVCEWGLKVLDLQSIKACAMVGNRPSARVLEKCGFGLEGTVREIRYANGKPADYWVYRQVFRQPVVT